MSFPLEWANISTSCQTCLLSHLPYEVRQGIRDSKIPKDSAFWKVLIFDAFPSATCETSTPSLRDYVIIAAQEQGKVLRTFVNTLNVPMAIDSKSDDPLINYETLYNQLVAAYEMISSYDVLMLAVPDEIESLHLIASRDVLKKRLLESGSLSLLPSMNASGGVAFKRLDILEQIIESIQGKPKEYKLTFDALQLNDAQIEALAKKIKGAPIDSLSLKSNNITHEGIVALVDALSTHQGMTFTLALSHNPLGKTGVLALRPLVEKNWFFNLQIQDVSSEAEALAQLEEWGQDSGAIIESS